MCNKSCDRNMFKLFIKLTEYINVFFKKNAKKLFFYKSENHIINLNENDSFYELIYSLLIIELRILQKYLNDILIKN